MRSEKLSFATVLAVMFVTALGWAEQPRAFLRAQSDLAVETGGAVRVVVNPATSRARLIHVPAGVPGLEGATPKATAADFFARYGGLFGLEDAEHDLELVRSSQDRFGMTHLEFHQYYRGVPVFGAQLRVHLDPDGKIVTVNGTLVPDLALDTSPSIPPMNAEAIARAVMVKENGIQAVELDASKAELLVYRAGLVRGVPGFNHLVWKTEVSHGDHLREAFFIDAHDGRLVDRINQIPTITRWVDHFDTSTVLWQEGDPLPFSGLSPTKDPEVNNLIETAQETYDLYLNITGGSYKSFDGHDAAMTSIYESTNLADSCPNAQWNGSTTDFCFGLAVDDVIAHEWTHGYTQFNHDLIYAWQPGALNESYSDIFGETVDLLNGRGLDDPSPPRALTGCSSFGGSNLPVLEVTAPEAAVGLYSAANAIWNPDQWEVSGTVELVDDGTDTATDACEPLNSFTADRIALIDRGGCQFRTKALNAEDAGAVAIIVANDEDDSLVTMSGGDPPPEIPALFIGLTDGQTLKSVVDQGLEVVMGMDSSTDDSVRWLIGEDVSAGRSPIRDMWNPNCLGDPGSVKDGRYFCSDDDNGGVHINSGVSNHAFALMVDGGTYNGQSIAAIGLTKAAHIYWWAMSVYQGPTSGFPEHADLMELSCADLIGQPLTSLSTGATIADTIDAFDCEQVAKVMTAVDMRAKPACAFDVVLQPNPPALPAGKVVFSERFTAKPGSAWTITFDGVYPEYNAGRSAWRWTEDVPEGGDGGAFFAVDSVSNGNCQPNDDDQSGVTRLESPAIEIPPSATGATLVFDHWVATEDGWDGGNLEISVNGGDYQPVPAEAFLFNPYNGSIIDSVTVNDEVTENSNPLAGQPAYTGQDQGHVFGGSWGQSQVDLDSFADPGDTVQLRWDLGVDGCNGFEGWYVDNVRVIAEGISPLAVRHTNGRRVVPENPF